MRTAIGGAWLYGIVMVFMVILFGYVSIIFNYSKAFRFKDDVVSAIEECQGFNNHTIERIQKLASKYNYQKQSFCQEDYIGINLDDISAATGYPTIYKCGIPGNTSKPVSMCIGRHKKETLEDNKYYYRVEVFFGFGFPVVGDLFTFHVMGESNVIYYPKDQGNFEKCNNVTTM